MLAGWGSRFRLSFLTWLFCFATSVASLTCSSGKGGGSSGTGTAGSGQAGSTDAATAGDLGTGVGGTSGVASDTTGIGGTTGAAGTIAICGFGTKPPSAMAGPAECTSYCTTIMTNCTGTDQQYGDMATCMKACSYMPAGLPHDDGVNSASCRALYAGLAAMDKTRCYAAGPLSGGACGNTCDLFCTVATSYCSAAGGFAGTPPYASCDDCLTTCSQFSRVVESGTPGSYSASYTPGPTADTTDTLECRAFNLFIDALRSPTSQAASCPNAANSSPTCGPGIVPPSICGAGTNPSTPIGNLAVCTAYCNAIMANCTGSNQQYPDMADCMAVCFLMPAGVPTDDGVNSASCRTIHAMQAATDKTQCLGAGPLSEGSCGNDCDLFCTVATYYCSAGSVAGTPPYASCADCLTTCGQFGRVYGSGMPGSYSATYTPGHTAETTDTLECRAFNLFIEVVQRAFTSNQKMYCPDVANMSPTCGMGIVPYVIPDGGTTSDGQAVTHDGGLVSVINSTNWNETTFYPFSKRRMLVRDAGNSQLVLLDFGRPDPVVWRTPVVDYLGNAMQLIGNGRILGGTSSGYQVFDCTTGAIVKTVSGFGNTQSAYRMANGETMLTRSGTSLDFLDKNDQVAHSISYPGFGYVRLARPTRNGTFLVPSDATLFEGDANGNVFWTATGPTGANWGHIWEPLLMADGNVLLSTGFGASLDVVDKTTHMVIKRYGTAALPNAAMFGIGLFREFQILPNGNMITSNSEGHGGGSIQVIEFNPAGDVTWFYKQDPTVFSSISGVMVIDGMDPRYLHVQEISTDSTWQPVIPTP